MNRPIIAPNFLAQAYPADPETLQPANKPQRFIVLPKTVLNTSSRNPKLG
jgi:hypothetical protein